MFSARGRTSSVTVFTVNPSEVALEGGEKLVYVIKGKASLLAPKVTVITLA